jgi:hypothetical protein
LISSRLTLGDICILAYDTPSSKKLDSSGSENMARKATVIKFSDHSVPTPKRSRRATAAQRMWLSSGLAQAGGKLPLFDVNGQRVKERTVRSCIDKGWAEPWFNNPIKPDWLICKLTDEGRALFESATSA